MPPRLDPETARRLMTEAGLEPQEPYVGRRDRPWPSRCLTCGKAVSPRLDSILRGSGCKWCAKRIIDPHDALVIMQQAGLTPRVPYPGAMTPWLCECVSCDKVVLPLFSNVHRGRGGCRWCAKPVGGAASRLDPKDAAKVMFGANLEPIDPYPGNLAPWRCRCLKCGAEVWPSRGNVQARGRGCRFCTPGGGFDATKSAIVYIMRNVSLDAVKVGISSPNGARLDQHRKLGWELVTTALAPGQIVRDCERAILNWWRKDLGLPVFLRKEDMPQGGWTETVELAAIDLSETIRRIKQLTASSTALTATPRGSADG